MCTVRGVLCHNGRLGRPCGRDDRTAHHCSRDSRRTQRNSPVMLRRSFPTGELLQPPSLPTLSGTVDTIQGGEGIATPSAGWPGVVKRRSAGAFVPVKDSEPLKPNGAMEINNGRVKFHAGFSWA